MDKKTRPLMITILLIALVQLPQIAITPGIDLIAREVFPEKSIQTIQTIMSLPSVIAVLGGVFAALAVRAGLARKKTLVVAGLLTIALAGAAAIFLHTHFWQLCLLNILIGFGLGIFVPATQSIMFDSFDQKTRQLISGVQSSVINGGAIILSILSGFLISYMWYGGHLVMLLTVPIAIVAFIVIPKGEKLDKGSAKRTKLPGDVYYFAAVSLIFMLMYNVGACNLSTHLADGNIGGAATAGVATAAMMAGGVVSGFAFPVLSPRLRDHLFPLSFILLFIGYSLLNLFPTSLAVTIVAVVVGGLSMSLIYPRCILDVSNLTDETNSATATMLLSGVAPGTGGFLSPVIITSITQALAGDSTRFRYQFSAFVCLLLAAVSFIINLRRDRRRLAAAESPAL